VTFTFLADLSTALDRVRFSIGDTDSAGYYLADETINALITLHGENGAIVESLRYILAQLSRPDFRADWLQVTNKEAATAVRLQLRDAIRRYGTGGLVAGTVNVYRQDSQQTEEPDYDTDDDE
jgi:hypothetical protein